MHLQNCRSTPTYLKYNEFKHIGKLSVAGTPPNLGPILEHITVSAEMQIISIIAAGNQTSVQAVLTPKYHQIIRISKHKMISGR